MASDEMASHASYNTNKSALSKQRDWHIVINEKSLEHFEQIREYFKNLKSCTYVLICEHIGQGHKHYHLFAQFNNTIKISRKKIYGSHIDPVYQTPQFCVQYIKCQDEGHKKDGVTAVLIDEWGTFRSHGGDRVGDLKKMTNEQLDKLPMMYYNIVTKIQAERSNDINLDDVHKNVKVYYIWGPSGIGKSRKAIEIVKQNGFKSVNMVKFENGFYHGIGTIKACIYDDFRDSHMSASEFINFIDYNKHHMNIKGGSKMNEYELIIITSIQDPYTIYKNMSDEPRKQWLRRIEIIHMEDTSFNDIKL